MQHDLSTLSNSWIKRTKTGDSEFSHSLQTAIGLFEGELSEDIVHQYKKMNVRCNMICQHSQVLGFSARKRG